MIKILIWGTGKCGKDFYNEIIKEKTADVIGFIESEKKQDQLFTLPVFELSEIKKLTYDFIIVASNYINEIKNSILEFGFPMEKFCFLRYTDKVSNNLLYGTKKIEQCIPDFSKKYCKDYAENKIIIKNTYNADDEFAFDYAQDYIRIKMFDLAAENIHDDMPGDVAELGVFEGTFSRHINRKFPNRTIYLFDTFEGFREEEAQKELLAGNCDQAFIDSFKKLNGSEEVALSRMKYREKAVIKKGLFPESIGGLETKFVFVSIDVDFEDSIFEGLKYFYPRMTEGGYIFVHDYNREETDEFKLSGVKKAVNRFEEEFGKMKKIAIPDTAGTLIIIK